MDVHGPQTVQSLWWSTAGVYTRLNLDWVVVTSIVRSCVGSTSVSGERGDRHCEETKYYRSLSHIVNTYFGAPSYLCAWRIVYTRASAAPPRVRIPRATPYRSADRTKAHARQSTWVYRDTRYGTLRSPGALWRRPFAALWRPSCRSWCHTTVGMSHSVVNSIPHCATFYLS